MILDEVNKFLDSLTGSTKLFIGLLLLGAVIFGIYSGFIPIDAEGAAILQTIIGGALLWALRQYSVSTKAKVEENTELTAETKAKVQKVEQLTYDYVQQTQLLQAAQLENAAYRRVFNKVRSEPSCAECAQMVAKEFESLRTRE